MLVPAFHHGAEIEALIQAGVECRFYDATSNLEPDPAELDALVSPATKALYVIHYLGIAQDVERWRRWCDARGLLLLEDAAQAWLASSDGLPVGTLGDLSIFCFYKTFGFPDGAALVSSSPAEDATPVDRRLSAIGMRHAAWAVGRSGILAGAARRIWTAEGSTDDDEFSLGEPSPPSRALDLLIVEGSIGAPPQRVEPITSCCWRISRRRCYPRFANCRAGRLRSPSRWSRTEARADRSPAGKRNRCAGLLARSASHASGRISAGG